MGGILIIKWAAKRATGYRNVFAHHQKRAPSALLAVSGFLRTRPFNCQISSESAHLIPKFTALVTTISQTGVKLTTQAMQVVETQRSSIATSGQVVRG